MYLNVLKTKLRKVLMMLTVSMTVSHLYWGLHLCPYGRKLIGSVVPVHSRSVWSNTYAFLDPSLKLVAFLLNYFTCFPIHNMIVLTDVVCYGWFMVLIGRKLCGWISWNSCHRSFLLPFNLCSVILVPSCLPVSPMYTFSHWLHDFTWFAFFKAHETASSLRRF